MINMTTLFQTYKQHPFELTEGHGVTLYDQQANAYLDLTSGIGVCNLGYNHPILNQAVQTQLGKIWHTSNLYQSSLQEKVASKLVPTEDYAVFFCNSGTEANEAALKLARKASGKTAVLSFAHSFHGRTTGALSVTGNEGIKEGFGPLLEDVTFDTYNDYPSLDLIHDELAAVIVEIIQGEGGVIAGTADWLEALNDTCHEQGVLLIVDEVQTGMGRTGKRYAFEHYAMQPDIITVAKGLANGLPVGAMIGKKALAPSFGPGSHGTTFGGNPLALTAADTVLDLLTPTFLEAVTQKSHLLWYFLEKELNGVQKVQAITGKGMMVGIQLAPEIPVSEVIAKLHQKGILTLSAQQNTLRLLPPLVIKGAQLIQAIQEIKEVIVYSANVSEVTV